MLVGMLQNAKQIRSFPRAISDGIYNYVGHIPHDLTAYYSVKRLILQLETKSCASVRAIVNITLTVVRILLVSVIDMEMGIHWMC